MELVFAVHRLVDHEFETKVFAQSIGVNDSAHSVVRPGSGVGDIGGLDVKHLDSIPSGSDLLFPSRDFLGLCIVVGGETLGAVSLFEIEAVDIVVDHSGHREMRRDLGDGAFDVLHPFRRVSLGVLRVVEGHNLIFEHRIDCSGVELVLLALVGIGTLVG